jgi:lysozyme
MSFNMGLPTLSKFTRTLQAIKNGRYSDAADEMLDSKWARQVGKRAERLSKQMRTGVRQ